MKDIRTLSRIIGNGRCATTWLIVASLVFLVLPRPGFSSNSPSQLNGPIVQTPTQVRDGSAVITQHYDPNQKLRLAFALTPPRMAEERQLIDQLHDKKSPQFHKFLTAEEWNDRFAPSASDEEAVVQWATSQGLTITHRYKSRLLVDAEAPVGVIEKVLGIKINNYKMGEKTYFSNDRDPSLPGSLTGVVQSVLGLNSFSQMRPAHLNARSVPRPDYVPGPVVAAAPEEKINSTATGPADGLAKAMSHNGGGPQITNGNYDPTDLYSSEAYDYQALYNQGHCCNPESNPGVTPPQSSIAIAAFGDLNYDDVYSFHDQYPYLAEHFKKIYIDGTYTCVNTPTLDDNCLEVTLDTEWSLSMSNSFGSYVDTSMVWIYEGSTYSYATIADVYTNMLDDGNARVFSTSWGVEESGYGDAGMVAADNIFTSMVGQGWTLVAASGDQGASAGCGDATAVQFPSSDPNVVAAGGTLLSLNYGPTYISEVGWTGGTYTGACDQNNGGSTGGFSSYWGVPSYQANMGFGSRAVPDISLNADAFQNMYYAPAGGLIGVGGTSIVAPELAGFFAQENAYGLSLGNVCGSGTSACSPLGNADYYLYDAGNFRSEAHAPYYDITSGCNTNDVTAEYGLSYYCAGAGFDEVTGWGSANMLQLAWAINWFDAAAYASPSISFGGPATNVWYNSDQLVDWDVVDNSGLSGVSGTGIAGFTQGWDSIPSDPSSEATPGSGNSFYSGPQHINETFGCTDLSGALCSGGVSQGCHTVHVMAWNNMGKSSGDQTYGPICYDTIAPTASISLSGTKNGPIFVSSVKVVLSASDSGSGVKSIDYQLDGGALTVYGSPISVAATGLHSITYYAVDVAGNKSAVGSASFSIKSPTAVSFGSSLNPSVYGDTVSLTAKVSAVFGGVPTGSVIFKDGSTSIGSAALTGGKAMLSLSTLPAGANSLTAEYNGDAYDEAATSPAGVETVKQAATSTVVSASSNPSSYGAVITLTATIKSGTTGLPAGNVTFRDGSTTIGSVVATAGKAVINIGSLSVGSHSITAIYGGNSDYLGSTSAVLNHVVQQALTTTSIASSLNPSGYGKSVTFTAEVKSAVGVPGGTISFMDGSTQIGTAALSGGKASFATAKLSAGTHSIEAVYSGATDYGKSKSAVLSQKVTP